MPRNRINYQTQALYAGPSPGTGQFFSSGNSGVNLINQLHRIQSAGYSFSINHTDVNQFSELAAKDRIITESPTVSLNFSYLLANFYNESKLGFNVDGAVSCISGILSKTEDERNYFIRVVEEGQDALANTNSAEHSSIGVGNGYLTSYQSSAAVGDLPNVAIGVEALNVQWDGQASGNTPAVDPENGSQINSFVYTLPTAISNPESATTGDMALSVLRPGDITISIKEAGTNTSFNEAGVDIDDAKIQSYNVSFDLSREPIQKLGSRFAISREITFPVNVRMDIDAIVGDLTTGSLHDILCDDTHYDIIVKLNKPDDCGQSTEVMAQYILKNAQLDSENFSASIGSNKTVSASFMAQIGGPNQTDVGLFMSGIYSN
jgi:hypothetical protein